VTVGLHLYGVVSADTDLPRGLAGRAGAEIRTVSDQRLAVLVSDIPDARVGRSDLLAHAHALEEVAETSTVIPIQFGMLMPDEATVRHELLGARGDRTAALLRAFEGLVQLTVTARYDEDAALREVVRRDPDLRARRTEAPMDTPSKMRLGEAVAQALEQLRAEDADLVVQRLAPHARAVAFNEVRDAYTATSLALLVERSARAGLDRAVADLRRDLARCDIRYVGPQPPYAFLDNVDTEASAWA
jgi:gas vesicle protein GvpL/GvpF